MLDTKSYQRGEQKTRGTRNTGSYNDRRDDKPQRNEERPKYEPRKA